MRINVATCAVVVAVWMTSVATAQAAPQAGNCNPVPSGASAAAINDCLANGNTVLEDGGVYMIDQTITIGVDGRVLQGQGDGNNRPILRAVTNLAVPILKASDVNGFTLSYLRFDGNLDARTNAGACLNGSARPNLANVQLHGGSEWVVDHVESANTLCSSAMEVTGSGFTIRDSSFTNNGRGYDYSPQGYWADGLTIWSCSGGHVHDNYFNDNTDVGLIVGGGHGCLVEGNRIENSFKHAFAGINVGWFPGGDGDHSGSVFRNNIISSVVDKMAFGIIIGNEPWWHDTALPGFVSAAGSITGNQINGAVVNLAIDGIDTGYIHDNVSSGNQGAFGFFCTMSNPYIAHFYGNADIQPGWSPGWHFGGHCGSWNTALPRPDNPGALVHYGGLVQYPNRKTYLLPGESVWSDNGQYQLVYQGSDGNLVVYDSSGGVKKNFAVPNHTPGIAIMQADGNFVIYRQGDTIPANAVFDTSTSGHPGAYLVVQGDGNVVVYDLSGNVLYQSS